MSVPAAFDVSGLGALSNMAAARRDPAASAAKTGTSNKSSVLLMGALQASTSKPATAGASDSRSAPAAATTAAASRDQSLINRAIEHMSGGSGAVRLSALAPAAAGRAVANEPSSAPGVMPNPSRRMAIAPSYQDDDDDGRLPMSGTSSGKRLRAASVALPCVCSTAAPLYQTIDAAFSAARFLKNLQEQFKALSLS